MSIIAGYLIVGAACLLIGAVLGNFSAHSDNERNNHEHQPDR